TGRHPPGPRRPVGRGPRHRHGLRRRRDRPVVLPTRRAIRARATAPERSGARMSRSHQMRRHARRMRRHGLQPMVVINSDDPLPDMVVVLIARWLWRYRSELGPLFIAITMMIAAAALHATHRSWWVGISAIAITTAPGLVLAGRRLGLSQLSERIY